MVNDCRCVTPPPPLYPFLMDAPSLQDCVKQRPLKKTTAISPTYPQVCHLDATYLHTCLSTLLPLPKCPHFLLTNPLCTSQFINFSPAIIFSFIFFILVSIIIFEVYFGIVFSLTPWIGNLM